MVVFETGTEVRSVESRSDEFVGRCGVLPLVPDLLIFTGEILTFIRSSPPILCCQNARPVPSPDMKRISLRGSNGRESIDLRITNVP